MRGYERPWIATLGLAEGVRRLDSGQVFVALDFETTGLYPERDRICEYGALKFSREGELEEYSLLCDPGIPISKEASAVSGITDEMVRGLELADAALASFMDFLGGACLMAHNAPFDISFLNAAVARSGRPKPPNPVFDSRTMAKEAFPGFPRYSLQDLAKALSIDAGSAHRALDDAYT